jgi:hypothetical protein
VYLGSVSLSLSLFHPLPSLTFLSLFLSSWIFIFALSLSYL